MVEKGNSGVVFFFFKQKTAYEIVSRDWSSDVCSSDLPFVFYLSSFLPFHSALLKPFTSDYCPELCPHVL